MTNVQNQLDPPDTDDIATFDCSHAVRLTGREWLVVAAALLALIVAGPPIGKRVERFEPGSDYRVPYELSHDFWQYGRHCRRACEQGKVLVIGDSGVWGHYVQPEQSLTHYLNELAGSDRFANLGLDGLHPAALEGLLRHYATDTSGRTVLLHLNPLWLSSRKHDLQTTKEFDFHHPTLVPQFAVNIPCYAAPLSRRIWIAACRKIPFARWASHIRTAHFEDIDPLGSPGAGGEPASERPPGEAPARQEMEWVDLEGSLQWQFFRRAVGLLRERDNRLFVLIGPLNESLLTDQNRAMYGRIREGMETWFRENDVPCLVPSALPPEYYVDSSHARPGGYAMLARVLMQDPAFAAATRNARPPGR